ncbi:MAG: hypothetical protein R2695_04075 [Acidimicrobiales bacterium]
MPDVRFDIDRVARVVYVAENLVHIKGELRGKPIHLEPFQVQHVLAPLFGWVQPIDGPREWVRVRRYGFLETGRKNGKTTTGSVSRSRCSPPMTNRPRRCTPAPRSRSRPASSTTRPAT